MDESEKRKQRLKAMCMEATKSDLDSPNSSNPSGHLLNPLAQPDTSLPAHERSARFDYYTDPMSAFSGGKKRMNAGSVHTPSAYSSSPGALYPSPLPGPRNTNMIPFPVPANQFQVNSSPYQGPYRAHSPNLQYTPQPSHASSPFPVRSPRGPPSMQNRSPSPSGFYNPPHTPGGSFMTSHGRGSPHTNSGRGVQSMSSGRGGYRPNFSNSPVPCRSGNSYGHSGNRNSSGRSGWSGGWKKDTGNGAHVAALNAPHLFYTRLMVADPWEELSPVMGSILVPVTAQRTPASSSWLPASIYTKKAKVDEGARNSRPRSNLAEYLALSFEEAADDEDDI